MASVLYLETNFPVGIATGRDPRAADLFDLDPARCRIAIPDICCMEALSWLEGERKRSNRFRSTIIDQIVQLKRDATWVSAGSLSSHLDRARIESGEWLEAISARLEDALDRLSLSSELIAPGANSLREARGAKLLAEPTDNWIEHAILGHARADRAEHKAFLSGNFSDFDQPAVRAPLAEAGVIRYFRKAEDALGWLGSLPIS